MMEGFGGIQEDSLVIGNRRAWYRIDLPLSSCFFAMDLGKSLTGMLLASRFGEMIIEQVIHILTVERGTQWKQQFEENHVGNV